MTRVYRFKWFPTKDRDAIPRHTLIRISHPTGKTEIDAKNAMGLFVKSCGNLNKNTIIKIQELDENGEQIGEDITPSTDENAIIPSGR